MSKQNPSPFEKIIAELQAFFKGPNLPDVLSAFDIMLLFKIFKQIDMKKANSQNKGLSTKQHNYLWTLYNKLVWLGYFKQV